MATIAKGSITLVNVNDAYSVLFTPDSCAITADYDGTNPDLSNAFTDITVVRGEEKQTFKLTLSSFSNSTITYQQTAIDGYTKRIQLTSIPSDVLSGALTFTITTDDEFVADVTFTYSVVRETSMLDWILDWENNKTVVGDTYLITPKIFVGKKVEDEDGLKTLTGVYIGPDDDNTAGIYGYKDGVDVFHINAEGAMLGGWTINKWGLSTSNKYGRLQIISDGSMAFYNTEDDIIWRIAEDGSAEFAQGNVYFSKDGDASFSGEIVAESGRVGGWIIDTNCLSNKHIALNSSENIIGVSGGNDGDIGTDDVLDSIILYGGVCMFYESANSFGIKGYAAPAGNNMYDALTNSCYFSLGSENKIANWNFDKDSLYMGSKVNMATKYTAAAGAITIGSNGLRGKSWYIDTDGKVSFATGNVQFTEESGSIVGWNLNSYRLSNANMAIVSETTDAGIYMSVADGTDFNNLASSSLTDYIDSNGGIYMKIKTDGVSFAAYDSNGKKLFKLRSNGESSIADWNIDSNALYVGTKKVTSNSFTDASGSMTFGETGIRGYKWRFESDGAGAIAGGNIQWDKDGNVSFADSVKMGWGEGISIAQRMAYGKMLYRDTEFAGDDFNGTGLYINGAGSREIVTDLAPNSTQRVMKFLATGWESSDSHRIVGFYFANQSRAGAEFVARIVAKIPVGLAIANYHNQYGDGGTTKWLTSQDGTGEYTEYLCYVKCGASGTFSTINHFALFQISGEIGSAAGIEWSVAYATVIDISSSDKFTTTIDVNGIYTGTLRADQIVAGTIDAANISADVILSNGEAWALNKDGSGYLANGNISWDKDGENVKFTGEIIAKSGTIGDIEIYNDHIGAKSSADESGDAAWASLSLYKNFFKVGGAKGYVMFGNDVIPATAGGAFTAVGRIVNQAPNTAGSYGFDQANYGLFINVSGGTKNYGIYSDAALMAPAFVNTKCCLLNFTGGTYTIDFSQYNIILMYYNESGYSGTNVTLPTESSIARSFGLSSLPENFATLVLFRVREGSLPITLKGIYDANEASQDYKMASGDSIMVLITKADGFRYQIVNHSY